MQYAHVILPLKLDWSPIYKGPDTMQRGDWVKIIFAHREYIAVIDSITDTPNISEDKIGEILQLELNLPSIGERELELWHFVSDYYLCTLGEVFKAAYPITRIKALKSILAANKKRYDKCKVEKGKLESTLEQCKCKIASKSEALNQCKVDSKTAEKLSIDIEKQQCKLLELQVRLEALEKEISQLKITREPHTNNVLQKDKSIDIKPEIIVSNNRIEYYLKIIEEALAHGGQVLILIPSISDCNSIATKFKEKTYPTYTINSSSTDSQRREAEHIAHSGKASLFIGSRVAIWLPFSNLTQIIVEKEHDILFKQSDRSPRFNARDIAVVLANIHKSKILLGSSEPSLESRYNIICGKYTVLECEDRAASPSRIEVVDINQERRKNGMRGAFSCILIDRINHINSGNIALIRGWEKSDVLEEEIHKYIKNKADIEIFSYNEFRQKASGKYALVAILQADALVSDEDFRADERATQLVAELSEISQMLLIQSNVVQRFTAKKDKLELLRERQVFHLPPFSRQIDILIKDPRQAEAHAKELCRLLGAILCFKEKDKIRIRITLERGPNIKNKKKEIVSIIRSYEAQNKYYGHIVIDVDPQ